MRLRSLVFRFVLAATLGVVCAAPAFADDGPLLSTRGPAMFRAGDSPLAADGTPQWTGEDCQRDGRWMPDPGARKPGTGVFWVCLPLPEFPNLRSPALYASGLRGGLEVYVAGKRLLRRGWPTDDEPYDFFRLQSLIVPLPAAASGGYAYLRVYPMDRAPRALDSIGIGEERRLAELALRSQMDLPLIGAIAFFIGALAAFFGIAHAGRRRLLGSFGVFGISIGVFCLAVSGAPAALLGGHALWSAAAFVGLALSPAALTVFNDRLLFRERNRTLTFVWRVHLAQGAVFAAAFALYGLKALPYLTVSLFCTLVLTHAALVTLAVRDARAGRGGSGVYAGGLFLFAALSIYDIAAGWFGLLPWIRYTFHWGLAGLLCSLAYVLERRLTLASEALRDYAAELESANRDLNGLNKAYGRFVPREFLQFLKRKSILDVQLGDNVEMELSLLVTDIHSFTTLTERMTPKENFDFVNSYFGKVGPIIRSNHGFIAKYTGDGLMALFPRRPEDALNAALTLQKEMIAYNSDRISRDREPIRTGIGVHTGVVRLGTVGDGERMQGDVMADAANLASRLESLTRRYGALIVMSERTFQMLEESDRYQTRLLDIVRVKGKSQPVAVIELLAPEADENAEKKIATREDFKNGLALYMQREFPQACDQFQRVIDFNPADSAARIYYDRALSYAMYGPPPDWEPVEALDSK